MHTTFQYGGTKGKRNRMREALLWVDEPPYYSGGWVLAWPPGLPCSWQCLRSPIRRDCCQPGLALAAGSPARRPPVQRSNATRSLHCKQASKPANMHTTHLLGWLAVHSLLPPGPAEGKFLSVDLQTPAVPKDFDSWDDTAMQVGGPCGH